MIREHGIQASGYMIRFIAGRNKHADRRPGMKIRGAYKISFPAPAAPVEQQQQDIAAEKQKTTKA